MVHEDSKAVQDSKSYLRGQAFKPEELDATWKQLKKELEFGYARRVLELYRRGERLSGQARLSRKKKEKLCQQHALVTSKDPDTSAAVRHDRALDILREEFVLRKLIEDGEQIEPTTNRETLGIAGGIWKRKWRAFGQLEDLHQSLVCYARGHAQGVENDFGYTAINEAFVNDLLAHLGDRPQERRKRADEIRHEIFDKVTPLKDKAGKEWLNNEWWYQATLAEAHFGLGEFDRAAELLGTGIELVGVDYWEFETTARQLVDLAWLRYGKDAVENAGVLKVLQVLTGEKTSVGSVFIGKVGLALSGGGFRASFYHLGVLARLAELDVLRHVDVLSCVSGGSVVGAAYYLLLRRMHADRPVDQPLAAVDYINLVATLIDHFEKTVGKNVREKIQDGWLGVVKNLWTQQGGLNTNDLAKHLDDIFYKPLAEDTGLHMHELNVHPLNHDEDWRRQGPFNPKRHNWRRAHKVPGLVLNATTNNTGHAWQFTTTWMGESPYAIHEEVDSVSRLRRTWYNPDTREVTLGQAVAASAAVPGVFGPLRLRSLYERQPAADALDVFLADGGVYDNQGTVSLLSEDCNVLLVSDATGQLMEDHSVPEGVTGRLGYATRSIGVLMERIRQANYADLKSRLRSGQLRGLMFLHMKDGLESDPIDWVGSQERHAPTPWKALTRFGVRRDIQRRLAELRTDIDEFNAEERRLLMACGYQMATQAYQEMLEEKIPGLSAAPSPGDWVFASELQKIRSTKEEHRRDLLERLEDGSETRYNPND